jgi:hypothetical protein
VDNGDGDDLAETGASVGLAAFLAAGCLAVGAVMLGRTRRRTGRRS